MCRSSAIGVLICLAGCSLASAIQSGSQPAPVDWLSGSGETLVIHVNGVAIDESGNKVANAQIKCEKKSRFGTGPLQVQTSDEGGFRINVPCKESWWTIRISGESSDGSHFGRITIGGRELRSIASNGLELTLLKREGGAESRSVGVKVVDENGPVAGASVKAVIQSGDEVVAIADINGLARIPLLNSDKLFQLTAWKEEKRIGGFQITRQPAPDPTLNEYTVELNRSRPTKVRLVDEKGQPVPDVRFELNVSIGAPNYNFLGSTDYTTMTTDKNGEAMVNWFPDWADANYDMNLKTSHWLVRDSNRKPIQNNEIEIVLKKSREDERQTVQGRVDFPDGSPAGLQVLVHSFQGEVEHRSDHLTAFTDLQGNFFVDVLPDATYCYYIDDSQWVSETKDAILFDSTTGKVASPVLKVVKSEEVQVVVTQGPDRQPLPNQPVTLRSVHEYSWNEDGRQQKGSAGRSWNVITDASGSATTFATRGTLLASVYSPDWQAEETIEVVEGKTCQVRLHRPFASAITLAGKLSGPADSVLGNTQVTIAALDGQTMGQSTVQSDEQGNFEFEVKSAKVGIYAYTSDGRHSEVSVIDVPPAQPIELELKPTVEYAGQLIGDKDQPLANSLVRAKIQLDLGRSPEFQSSRRLDGNTIETATDKEGRYVLSGIPVGIRFVLEIQPVDKSSAATRIGERFATAGEDRPLDVYRVAEQTTAQPKFAEYVTQHLGDCRRYGICSLVVVLSDDRSLEWATEITSNYDENRAILGYLPMLLKTSDLDKQVDRQRFLAKYELQVPEPGNVTLCVLNGSGESLARVDLDCNDLASRATAYEFISSNEPAAADARKKLDAALDEARKTGRVVWAQHSQTRCGPCFRLSRWIDEHRQILEKQFVFVKVDDVREENGIEVAKRVTGDRHFGIPFVAIMSPAGEVLIDGEGPLGNIGFPSDFESSQHLRKMISSSGNQIADSELDVLIKSLVGRE